MSLPAILRVEDVMARYGMRDQRTARRLMNTVGAFKVGGRLVVREDGLAAWELGQASQGATRPAAALPARAAAHEPPWRAHSGEWTRLVASSRARAAADSQKALIGDPTR